MIVGLPIGIMQSNCYIVYDDETHDGVIVDAGGDTVPLLREIEKRGVQVRYILNTHGHFDHIAGNAYLASLGVPYAIHPADRELLLEGGGATWFGLPYVPAPPPTVELTDGLTLEIGHLHIQVVHTPGHTPGSVCLYIPEEAAMLTGDTLFAGGVGRVDLPGGDARAFGESLKRLMGFPPETRLYPGHGPATTLAHELETNPWIRWILERS